MKSAGEYVLTFEEAYTGNTLCHASGPVPRVGDKVNIKKRISDEYLMLKVEEVVYVYGRVGYVNTVDYVIVRVTK